MRLSALKAVLHAPGARYANSPETLSFDCPCCQPGEHRYDIPLVPKGQAKARHWEHADGDTIENLTITPSVRSVRWEEVEVTTSTGEKTFEWVDRGTLCWHGFVTNGDVTFCGDSLNQGVPR